MSLKVWEAYRLKPGVDVWDFACDIREKAQRRARRSLKQLIEGIVKDCADPAKLELLHAIADAYFGRKVPTRQARSLKVSPWVASTYLQRKYREQVGRMDRNPFDMDVAVVFRRHPKGFWVVIPYPGSGLLSGCLRFLKRDKRLSDYHYQNSSDKSAKCSDRAWNERGRYWDRALDNDIFDNKLTLDIVSCHGFLRVDPSIDMERALRRKRERATPKPAKAS